MSEFEIRSAGADERQRALTTVLLGFACDPVARWVWPDPDVYLATMPRFIAAFGGRAFDHGTAHIASHARAVALWLPPGVEPDGEAMQALIEETLRPEIDADMEGFLEGMARHHPEAPHWYLPMIAADPRWMGQGLGAALLKHALRRCDADGLPAYLESSNPRNISLYERHGFEAVGEIQSGSSPVMTPMLRLPRG
ncbi:MAG: GNAT family N-acetyltransferase [Hyphomonadaceae bacterium]